jgi:hypothetical protein
MTRSRVFIDKGHWPRKAVWVGLVVVLTLPYLACVAGGALAKVMLGWSSALHTWSHPCLYAPPPLSTSNEEEVAQ